MKIKLTKKEQAVVVKLIEEKATLKWQSRLTTDEVIALGTLAYKLGLPVG